MAHHSGKLIAGMPRDEPRNRTERDRGPIYCKNDSLKQQHFNYQQYPCNASHSHNLHPVQINVSTNFQNQNLLVLPREKNRNTKKVKNATQWTGP